VNKRHLLAAAAILAVTVTSSNAAEIEFWYGNTGSVEDAIQAECKAFNESQSEHAINCVGQGSYEAGFQKAIAAYRSQTHPTLIQFFDGGTLDVMLSGAIEPVYQLMPDVDWDDYLAGARGYYESSKGELYSQPYNGSTLIFFGNRDMLAKAGVTELPETWEAFETVATKLKEAGIACPFVTDGHPWRIIEQFAARHAVPIATQHNGYGGMDAEYTFNEGLIAQHLTNLAEWHEDGLVRLKTETKAGDQNAAFASGECAMMVQGTGAFGSAYAGLGDNVMVALAPMYEGYERHNTLIGGASIYVMKGHSDDEIAAAKAFLDFVRQPDQQIQFTKATGYLPVTLTALNALKDSGRINDPAFGPVEVGVDSLNQPSNEDTKGIRLGFFTPARDIMIEETTKVFNGDQDMQTALDNSVTRGNELLRRFEQTYQGVDLP